MTPLTLPKEVESDGKAETYRLAAIIRAIEFQNKLEKL